MADATGQAIVACQSCHFWHGAGSDATCRRHAPGPAFQSLEIARWPETRASDSCGEGVARDDDASSPASKQQCADCAYWNRPGIGIDPSQRGDRLRVWWQQAGFCRRFAPRPGGDIGEHAFWRATHATDYCFEGRPR